MEEVLEDTVRQLRAAEGQEEALRAKVGHMRHEADVAQAACEHARAAEAAALRVILLLHCSDLGLALPHCAASLYSPLLLNCSAHIV